MRLNKLADERRDLNKGDVMTALKNLNEAWNYLYQAEQRKIVRLLVNAVEIHENGLKLNLNLDGFDNLLMELAS
jgi:muramidase (phage lysozyme)